MKYKKVEKAIFIERPNRFIARVIIDGAEETVHVKNTGRCKEILRPGTTVILERVSSPSRKTRYSLIAGYKGEQLINIDSQAPNQILAEALKAGKIPELKDIIFKREYSYKDSRFDFYFETSGKRGLIEVKGVTLEASGEAFFPDAPTQRGTKHVKGLSEAFENGYLCYVIFIIQMKGIRCVSPHKLMDREFSSALESAFKKGVNILAYDCIVKEDEIVLDSAIQVVI